MLKAAGLGCLFLGCVCFGMGKSANLRKRRELLEEFRRCLLLLSGEIRCVHSPLPDAFRQMGKKVAEPYRTLFTAVADGMEREEKIPLGEIFEENVRLLDRTVLLREDKGMILELGRQLGYLDIEMQLKTLELCETVLEDTIQKAAGDYSGKARIYRYLGVLTGLFLVVLLV